MAHVAPKDIWDVSELLKFDMPLDDDSELYVDMAKGRGDFSMTPLYRDLGIKRDNGLTLHKRQDKEYIVFCGHRGCGKSTELRRLAIELHRPNLYFVIFSDVSKRLDFTNLQYPDVLMNLVESLLMKLDEYELKIPNELLDKLGHWFTEKVISQTKARDSSLEIKTGAEMKSEIPFLSKLFASLTSSFKTNVTYKDELRRSIKNNFAHFAVIFNQLIVAAEQAVEEKGIGLKILFVVDGTDKLNHDDAKRFFIHDAHQLQLVSSNFIYCCPFNLLHEGNAVQQGFKHHILPMIKITEKDGTSFSPGYAVLRQMILKRADFSLFENEETLDKVITFSGGSPREILKILERGFSLTETESFDAITIDRAVNALATDYRRFLHPEDYHIIHSIDHDLDVDWNQDRENLLLYNLAILEYNSYWRRSHPVVRTLDGYQARVREFERNNS